MKLPLSSMVRLSLLITMFPALLDAAELSIDSSTIIRFEQREMGPDKQNMIPATQFLGLDVTKMADGNLSLHLYGWGRADLADNSYNDSMSSGDLTYGYLQYRPKSVDADIRAGRFFVREGIVNEQVDGMSARTSLPLGFGISAFGGATVHTEKLFGEDSDGKGDYIYGGRFNYRYKGALELGVAGVYEDKAPVLRNYANGSHRLVGGDIWLSPAKVLELMGHSSYNTETSGFAEHSYLLLLKPLKQFVLNGEFNDHRERNFLYSWSMFSGAALNPSDKSRSIGAGATYEMAKGIEVGADYKHYEREMGNADRYGGELKLAFLDNKVRSGVGYHYLQAGKGFAITGNPSATYHEVRGYLMHDGKSYFAAVDLLGFFFKDKIYNKDSMLEGVLSLGYRISPVLTISGDVSYGRNPQFENETKGLVRLTANTIASKGGKK